MRREIIFDIKEENHSNFAKSLIDNYNGEFDGTKGSFNNEKGHGNVWVHKWNDDLETGLFEINLNDDSDLIRKATHDKKWLLLVFNLSQSINQEILTDKSIIGNIQDGIFVHCLCYDAVYRFKKNMANRIIIIRINKDSLSKFTTNNKILSFFKNNNTFAFYERIDATMFQKVSKMFAAQKDKDFAIGQTTLIAIDLTLSFLRRINQRHLKSFIGRGLHPKDIQLMQEARSILISSFKNKITLPELAQELNISVSKLKRDFKKYYNTNVTQFYTDLRMNKAYEYLETGSFQVSDVAEIVGYESLPQFTQTFKKYHGVLPNQVILKKSENEILS
ncbi:AraC family transcriptional regulator [Halosquirtibacter laminarini]|uniref:AraC family transcriptional regulator n=1 Tax=Halosquirtibacter laminarini TaxID=3374600 RepID=A0AC61NI74_9BACT|nr:AraC family transcriptional regulator [Prolixibacteraceae bacterium]